MSEAINLKNIKFNYANTSQEFSIKDLQVTEGEKVFLHGPSGSGKSTLLNLISGVLIPNSGELNVLGTDLSKLSQIKRDKFRGDHFGVIFQNFNLIPYLNIFENIKLPLVISKKGRKLSANINIDIENLITKLNLKEHINKNVLELSIGQQQRVAVARALINQPKIIIADEPTSALDDAITEEFMNLLLEQHEKQNFTLIFVSHDRSLSKYFDREISIENIRG